MRRGSFLINGKSSEELKSVIQFRPSITAPMRKVQRKSIQGVSGDYIFDEEAYENTPIPLSLFANVNSIDQVNEIKDDIVYAFEGGRYIEFVPYWDSEMTYEVEVVEPPIFQENGNHLLAIPYSVELSAKPFKKTRETVSYESSTEISIINPYNYVNEPIITLYGTGDMNLIVNGITYPFQDVDTDIIVDSRIESAYRVLNSVPDSRDNRMYTSDFPVFKSGNNTVSISGNATSFKVETRWRKLVS